VRTSHPEQALQQQQKQQEQQHGTGRLRESRVLKPGCDYAGDEEVQYIHVTLPKDADAASFGAGTVVKFEVRRWLCSYSMLAIALASGAASCKRCHSKNCGCLMVGVTQYL
jgi:hypothetical protein